jgi:hypothetical protein
MTACRCRAFHDERNRGPCCRRGGRFLTVRAEDRHKLEKRRELRPPAFGSMLGAELLRGARTVHFWLSLARNSIPLFGVFVWGWDVLELAVYILLQSWLMGAMYCAIDMTFNPEKERGKPPADLLDAIGPLLTRFAGACVVFAVLVGIFGWFVLGGFFRKAELLQFFDGGWQQPTFLWGVLALVAGCLAEATRFLRSLPRRTPADVEADNRRFAATFRTVVLLAVISAFLGGISRLAFGLPAFAVFVVLVLALMDIAPRSMDYLFAAEKSPG